MNLEPKIIPNYDNGSIKIIFSEDFQKIYDAELDYIDCIKNYYWEDPNHCRIFNFKDIYKFDKDLDKLNEIYEYELMNKALLESIKIKVMDLCNKFIYGYYTSKSSDYYTIWNQEKFK